MPSANDSVWTSKVMLVLDSSISRWMVGVVIMDGWVMVRDEKMRSPPAWTKALPRGS